MTKNIFEYIRILLPRHKCVTLPGFGAFILNRDESDIFDAQKCLMSPSYSITFNSRLQHDDGTLTSYIQALKGTTYDKASKDLSILIKELRNDLLIYKEIDCGSLGRIELTDSSILFFQNRDYFCPTHFGLSPIGLRSITNISQSIEKETKTYSFKKRLIATAASAAVVLLLVLPSTNITDSTEQGGSQQAGYLSSLAMSRTEQLPEVAPVIDEVEAIDIEIEDYNLESNTATKPKSGRTYYLIVGGESSATNAAKTLRKFRSEGFATAEILESSQRFRIYTQTFDNMEDADRAVVAFRAQNPQYASAWIHSARN